MDECKPLEVGPNDTHISYLPLAHIYERVTMLVCLFKGSKAGFFRGDVLGLLAGPYTRPLFSST